MYNSRIVYSSIDKTVLMYLDTNVTRVKPCNDGNNNLHTTRITQNYKLQKLYKS